MTQVKIPCEAARAFRQNACFKAAPIGQRNARFADAQRPPCASFADQAEILCAIYQSNVQCARQIFSFGTRLTNPIGQCDDCVKSPPPSEATPKGRQLPRRQSSPEASKRCPRPSPRVPTPVLLPRGSLVLCCCIFRVHLHLAVRAISCSFAV